MPGFVVYIGNLYGGTRERDVEKFLKGYGRLRNITMKDRYCFVEFDDYKDADDAVYELDNTDLLGNRVAVQHAQGGRGNMRRPRPFFRNRGYGRSRMPRWADKYGLPERTEYRVIVRNLSSACSWQDLKDHMRSAGEVTYSEAHSKRSNEGIVEFETYRDMKNAKRKLDGSKINGRRIELEMDCRYRRSYSDSRSRSRSRSYNSRSLSRSRSNSPRGRRRSRTPRSSRSPKRSSRSPKESSKSPKRSSRSPKRSSMSPKRSSVSPRKSSRSPKRSLRSPKQSSRSPKRSSRSPKRSSRSPKRSSRSPKRSSRSPKRSSRSPRRRSYSPRRPISPRRRSRSPRRRPRSPRRYSRSRSRDSRSPRRRYESPRRSRSPKQASSQDHNFSPSEKSKSNYERQSRSPSLRPPGESSRSASREAQ